MKMHDDLFKILEQNRDRLEYDPNIEDLVYLLNETIETLPSNKAIQEGKMFLIKGDLQNKELLIEEEKEPLEEIDQVKKPQ